MISLNKTCSRLIYKLSSYLRRSGCVSTKQTPAYATHLNPVKMFLINKALDSSHTPFPLRELTVCARPSCVNGKVAMAINGVL